MHDEPRAEPSVAPASSLSPAVIEAIADAVEELSGAFKQRGEITDEAMTRALRRYAREFRSTAGEITRIAEAVIDDEARKRFYPDPAEMRTRLRQAMASRQRDEPIKGDRSHAVDCVVLRAYVTGTALRLIDYPWLAPQGWGDELPFKRPARPSPERLVEFVDEACESAIHATAADIEDAQGATAAGRLDASAWRIRYALRYKPMLPREEPIEDRCARVINRSRALIPEPYWPRERADIDG